MSGCSGGVVMLSLVSQKNVAVTVTLVRTSFAPRVAALIVPKSLFIVGEFGT